ncbi:MAG TPA: hypothetical protein PKY82_34235, partial [Pyrinomonadaceae bacterium]|nr:hypothetical protein [Pyrinomonadaceae bacterium]
MELVVTAQNNSFSRAHKDFTVWCRAVENSDSNSPHFEILTECLTSGLGLEVLAKRNAKNYFAARRIFEEKIKS